MTNNFSWRKALPRVPNNQQDPYRDFGNLRYQFSPKRKNKKKSSDKKKSSRSPRERKEVKVLNFADQANMCVNLKSLQINISPKDLQRQDIAVPGLQRVSDFTMTPLSPGRPRQLAQHFVSDDDVKPSYVDYDLSKSQTPGSSISLFQNL